MAQGKKRKKSDTFLDKVGDAFRSAAKSGKLGSRRKIVATTKSDAQKKREAKKRRAAR